MLLNPLSKHLPLAQVMIPESQDRALNLSPCSVGSLLPPLPLTLLMLSLSLTRSLSQKINKIFKKNPLSTLPNKDSSKGEPNSRIGSNTYIL